MKSKNLLLLISTLAILLAGAAAKADTAAPAPAPAAAHPDRVMVLDAARAGRRIVAVGEHGAILLSDDDGKTQRQARRTPSGLTLTAVSFADADNGWAVGHGGVILHTADGGENWTLQRQDATVDQPLLTVHFRDALHGWAAGLWSLLLSTEDGGRTWRKAELPAPEGAKRADLNLLKIFATPAGRLYIAAERGTLLHSRDGGANWQYLNTGSKASLWSGVALDEQTLVVAGLGGRMLRSSDGGASWVVVNAGTGASITQLRTDGAQVWASALDGRLLHSADQGRSWQATGAAVQPLTALAARADGSPLRYARNGVVK